MDREPIQERVSREVLAVLKERGLLEQGRDGGRKKDAPPPRVTMGTAGKVFLGQPAAWKALPKPPQVKFREDGPSGAPAPSIAARIDHTLLKPEASERDIVRLCEEARACGFAAACIPPAAVRLAAGLLGGSAVKVATVVGFPFGYSTAAVKAREAEEASACGADELDMVLNVGFIKSRKWGAAREDIRAVRAACAGKGLKVILETALLNDEEKTAACRIAEQAGADFVKTSTGFAARGATVADVRLMRAAVGPRLGVKAAGGIRDLAFARALIEAGADRIGTSSSLDLLREEEEGACR